MTAEQILVIILSIALAIFLVLGIVVLSYLIVIVRKINKVASLSEQTVNNIAGMVANIQQAVAPAAVGNAIVDLINRFIDKKKK